MFHVVAPVAAVLQGAWCVSLVIYDVDAYFVVVTEAVVVDAGGGCLVDFAREGDGASVAVVAVRIERVVVAGPEE